MKKFHIVIKDNETNKILVDEDHDAILGACSSDDDDNVQGIGYTSCTGATLLAMYDTLFQVMKKASSKKHALWYLAISQMIKKEMESNNED